ncbi:MAG TPA: hypothetical protein DEP84_10745 [Chloroflexi bacterium]|nr:hypothetical protein [Chloroflexota bacterium]
MRYRRILMLAAILLLVVAALAQPSVAAQRVAPPFACENLTSLNLPDTTVTEAVRVTAGSYDPPGPTLLISGLPAFCRVHLVVAPQINIEVWMPIETWNGRFQGVGGGGFAGSISYSALGSAVRSRYATASTDTGHTGSAVDGSWALDANGNLNEQLVIDFAYRAIHEMTVKSKAVIEAFYGAVPTYSYFTGCSTGGRQGLMEAQRFPDDYDGIVSGAPAINWSTFIGAEL